VAASATAPVVAVINSNDDDVVEMLRLSFEQAGFLVVSAHADAIKRGATNLTDFVRAHKPNVIVFDLVPPYDRSYRFVEHLRGLDLIKGCHFVLTSTNPNRAHELAGTSEEVYEVVGKPYDLEQITRAVKEASRARPTR
jgi:CheY-like chemotaxis protein